MTGDEADGQAGATRDEYLAGIDELLARPFPEREYRDDSGFGGPGYHFRTLRRSRDFWEDRCEETVEVAEAEIQGHLDALTAAVAARWGDPEIFDLRPLVETPLGGAVPDPLNYLSMVAGDVQVWQLSEAGRWLGLAIGQADPEYPIELVAVVGGLEGWSYAS